MGSSSISSSGSSASAGTVGSSSASGCTSAVSSSRNDGTSTPLASSCTCPNSALVDSNPSSTVPRVPSPPGGSTSSARLVDSISSDVSGSGVTASTRPCASGASSGSGSGGRNGGATGFPFGPGGASTSRKTRLDVFRFPDFDTSSCGGGGAAGDGA